MSEYEVGAIDEMMREVERVQGTLNSALDALVAVTRRADLEVQALRIYLRVRTEQRDALAKRVVELEALVRDWLEFAKDVQPGCAAGADWLEGLRKRSVLNGEAGR